MKLLTFSLEAKGQKTSQTTCLSLKICKPAIALSLMGYRGYKLVVEKFEKKVNTIYLKMLTFGINLHDCDEAFNFT